MIRIETVTIDKVLDYLKFHASRHLKETGYSHKPDVDWELYRTLGQAKQMFAFLLKDAGQIVGYALFSIGTNPRCKTRLEATGDGLYVDSPYRVLWTSKLIKTALSQLQMMGVKSTDIITDDKVVGRWLSRQGAKNTYQVWSF